MLTIFSGFTSVTLQYASINKELKKREERRSFPFIPRKDFLLCFMGVMQLAGALLFLSVMMTGVH